MPEISVLMSVYNGEEFINESIDSILNQTYGDFEFIIINDGSTDKTKDIIENYNDDRIKLYNFSENQGIGIALNFGLEKVKGKYIAKADADDIYLPDRLVIQKEFLDKNREIDLVGTFITYFADNEEVKEMNHYIDKKSLWEERKNKFSSWKDIQEKIYWYCCLTHSSIMVRSDIIKKFRYREFPMGEDYDLFYRLNKKGHKLANLNQYLTQVRVLEESTTTKNSDIFFNKVLYETKKEEITNLYNFKNKVYIWGAGSFGRKVLKVLNKNDMNIHGFIDSNQQKQGIIINDKRIYSPDILDNYKEEDIKIIVASHPGLFEIVKILKTKGLVHLKDFVVC